MRVTTHSGNKLAVDFTRRGKDFWGLSILGLCLTLELDWLWYTVRKVPFQVDPIEICAAEKQWHPLLATWATNGISIIGALQIKELQ